MDSQILNMITHHNMIPWQHRVKKVCKSKTCHFWKIMQITTNFICINYKLSMATLNNIHQVKSNCMEAYSMCWIIICAFRFSSYVSWTIFLNNIVELKTKHFASQSSPHMPFANLLIEYALEVFKVVWCCLAIHWREIPIPSLLQTKKIILGPPTNALSLHWWHFVLG